MWLSKKIRLYISLARSLMAETIERRSAIEAIDWKASKRRWGSNFLSKAGTVVDTGGVPLLVGEMTVVRGRQLNTGVAGPPTREGSIRVSEKVRHSQVSSME